ncbi:hypothetical protein K438DRAFT_647679 [Mycena galopus ATCC 62051]|nr:hypothetical protein K438DRAFT_647679 [Mycena galopus ATCC 62051]
MPRSIYPLLLRSPPTSTNMGSPMAATATFHKMPLSTTVNCDAERSLLSLDWVMSSGIRARHAMASGILTVPCMNSVFSLQMDLCVVSSLPYDLVLGRDWIQYGCESVADPRFFLSSGIADLWLPQTIYPSPPQTVPTASDMVNPNFQQVAHNLEVISGCVCVDQHLCRCPSTSAIPMNNTHIKLSNIIHDIFLGHYPTRART